ncbi:MAG: threonine synthase [Spirochaetota bacterium]
MRFSYRCTDCGATYDTQKLMYQCPACKDERQAGEFQRGNLIVELNHEDLALLAAKPAVSAFDFFPYEVPQRGTYPVGNTPLARPQRLQKRYGLPNLTCKLDGLNPSGSFKDRASQLIAAQALALGEERVVLASTGNAGSAMACAGAAYGLEVLLFVPADAPVNKLMQSVLYGATVIPINGSYDAAFGLSIACSEQFGGINRNTAYNPMTVEGKKSVSIELYNDLERKAPDAVYIPVGDGVIFSGVYKGFHDLQQAGLIDTMPALICVQSSGSDAISRAWMSDSMQALEKVSTYADSISVASPANGRMAVDYIRKSEGWAVVVDDEQIYEAQTELSREAGIFAEPAAAAAWAGVKADLSNIRETFGADANIVTLITGTGFKDMQAFEGKASVPPAIEPTLKAMTEYMHNMN